NLFKILNRKLTGFGLTFSNSFRLIGKDFFMFQRLSRTAFFSLLFLAPFFLLAQGNQVEISGQIVDGSNNDPLAYATVSIIDSGSGKVLTGGITDDFGNFSVKASPGVYDIKFEYISYTT